VSLVQPILILTLGTPLGEGVTFETVLDFTSFGFEIKFVAISTGLAMDMIVFEPETSEVVMGVLVATPHIESDLVLS
jgi:hypothetical protein